MAQTKYFLAQVKRTSGTIEKGLVVKDTLDAARQSYHAYLGAYGYGNNANTDYVCCEIFDSNGVRYDWQVWPESGIPDDETEE